MKKLRLLAIINFFPPAGGGGVFRPLSLVRYLSRLGWEVTVVTPRAGEFWINDPELEKKVPPDVRVVRTASLSGSRIVGSLAGKREASSRRSSSGFGILRKLGEFFLLPDTYIGWVPFAFRAARNLLSSEKFDAVYSTSPPDSSHIAAALVTRGKIPWIADFRDPWINLRLRKPPTILHRTLHERLERMVMRADIVLVTTEAHEEAMRRCYPTSRIVRVPNGYDEEDFAESMEAPMTSRYFTIAHCGMLTLGRSAKPFLSGLDLFVRKAPTKAERIRVVFVGARESANEEWVARFGLQELVRFEDNLPHSEVVKLERRSHVLLLVKHDDERYSGAVPGKLYEYIGALRPILAIAPEGEAARLVRSLNRGEVASISSPQQIAEKLEHMFDLWCEGKLDQAYSLEERPEFGRMAQAEKVAELLSKIAR